MKLNLSQVIMVVLSQGSSVWNNSTLAECQANSATVKTVNCITLVSCLLRTEM
jgi:hypothetical protein